MKKENDESGMPGSAEALDPTVWAALPLFHHLAHSGSINRSAQRLGLSAATLGRRLTALEDSLHCQLFVRSVEGLTLTPEGADFHDRVRHLMDLRADIQEWRRSKHQNRPVTISAGHWMTVFLVRHLLDHLPAKRHYDIRFDSTARLSNVLGREADIGIRSVRPDQDDLVVKRGNPVRFAPYCSAEEHDDARLPWVHLVTDTQLTPSVKWLRANVPPAMTYSVTDTGALLGLVQGGNARTLLPDFIGETDPSLRRCGDPVPSLDHVQWLVVNEVDRRHPNVRDVFDGLVTMFESNC